jgi:hypothetical protein
VTVELRTEERGLLAEFLSQYDPLIGDARTQRTFGGVVEGVIGAGSLCCARIAAFSPTLAAAGAAGEKRVRRMIQGESTKRSVLSEDALVGSLQGRAVQQLAGRDEVWVAVDMSDLRKPYARAMEALMEVRPLSGTGTVPGYRTITALGMGGGGRRGVLYHHLFSSQAAGFLSEPAETQTALASVQAALAGHAGAVTYLVDRGFDDDEVWGRIWANGDHLVCRVFHLERLVEAPGADGAWARAPLAAVAKRVRPVAEVRAEMLVRKRGQRRETRQDVAVRLAACPVRVPYRPPDAPRYPSARRQQEAWLVRVTLEDVEADPWWLLTDWPVEDAASALRVFRMYRQRWAAEDAFKFAKDALGWEDVQLMNLADVQTLSALGWVAAAFLYELGVGLDEPALQLLVRLAGGELRPTRPPGKAILTRGLRRLLDHFVTDAFLRRERAKGALPPQIAAFLRDYGQPP